MYSQHFLRPVALLFIVVCIAFIAKGCFEIVVPQKDDGEELTLANFLKKLKPMIVKTKHEVTAFKYILIAQAVLIIGMSLYLFFNRV